MKFAMKLSSDMFNLIKSGEKTIELRLNDDKGKLVSINDEIEFTNLSNKDEKLLTRVLKIYRFNSFADLYNSLPLLKCGYTKDTISNASPSDMLRYYSEEEQNKYVVVAFELFVVR